MNTRTFVSLVAFFLTLTIASALDAWQTLDLRAFTNYSYFEHRKPAWLLPRGQQVFDGVPFRVDGVIQLSGSVSYPQLKTAPKLVKDIPVTNTFDRLHLLAAIGGSEPESNTVLRVHLNYENGSNASLELKYGDQIRSWNAPMHKTERTVRDTNHAAIAWAVQSADDAAQDRYTRLFHITLENPQPASPVRSLTLESAATNSGPFIAGLTLGATTAPPLTNTVNLSGNPFPDLRKRKGDPATLTGVVKTMAGQPISNAMVRVLEERGFNTQTWQSTRVSSETNFATTTDATGRFTLPSLPDNKLYHLIAAAPNCDAVLFNGADPKSDPIEIRLPEFTPITGACTVHVKVVDESGQPIAGAFVERDGVRTDGGASWGGAEGLGFPNQAIADANGEFRFQRKQMFTALQMTIRFPGFAPNKCWVDASDTVQTVTLDVGAIVRGRVVKAGQPVPNVTVGVSGVDRNSEVYVGNYSALTDTNGVFEFPHLPARKSWWLYGTMDSLKSHGAIRPRQLLSGAPGETNEVEDLEVGPGLRLAGKLQTRHGEPLPDGLSVSLSMEHWDTQSVKADKAGNFEFTGVVPGKVTVNLRGDKWRFSTVNRSLDNWNSFQLVGLLQQDKDDFLLVIEPGEWINNYNNSNGQLPPADYAGARPLFGAESSGPIPIILAGQVLDDSTGKPVRAFKVVPGRKPFGAVKMMQPPKPLLQQLAGAFRKPTTPWNELPWWDSARTDTFSNGVFSVDFQPLTSTPLFRVEADGYEPYFSDAISTNTTNLVIRLKTGNGPSGVVLQSDGKPAVGAKIWYAVAREQAGLTGRELNNYGDKAGTGTTDTNGHFSFMPRPEGRKLFVAHTNGWAEAEVKPDDSNLKLQLAPWAAVKGTLVSSNGLPMVGIPLHLTHPYDWNAGDAIINMQGACDTDAKGQFFFTDVMPVRLDLIREIRMGTGGGYTHGPQTWFICQPGITNDLGKVIYDTPPPPPFSEKVKRVLGL